MSSMFTTSPVQKIIFFAVCFQSVRMLIGSISAIYLVSKGISIIDIGLIKTFQAGIIFALDIPLSYFADKKSRKLTIMLAVLFCSLWLLITGLAGNLLYFYVAEFFNAVAIALYGGSFSAYLIDVNKKMEIKVEIKHLLADLNKKQFLGMAIASFVGATFIGFSSGLIWFIAALLSFILFIFALFVLPQDNVGGSHLLENKLVQDIKTIIKDIAINPDVKGVVFVMIISSIFYQNLIQFWQPAVNFSEEKLIDEGYIYGVIFLLILLVQALAGYLINRLTDNQLWVVLALVLAIIVLHLFTPTTYVSTAIFIILAFFSYKMMVILLEAHLQNNIDDALRSTYASVISTIIRILLLVVMPLFSMLIETFQLIPMYVFYLGICIIFLFNYIEFPYKKFVTRMGCSKRRIK